MGTLCEAEQQQTNMTHLIFKAAGSGDIDALRSLLIKGVDIEWMHKGTGRTALIEATISGHRDAVALLLEHGAAIDHQCSAIGNTSLAWASGNGADDIVRDLIAHGAGLDISSPGSKRTALMDAAQAGHEGIVCQLIDAGANPHLLNFQQKNAWSLASDNGHGAIARILEKAGSGPPLPVLPPATLPWPTVTDQMAPTDNPAKVVRAYILAMAAWERAAWEQHNPNRVIDPKVWVDQQAIVDRCCTQKRRAYKKMSYGSSPRHAPEDGLLSVTMISPSKAEVIVLHDGIPEYEYCFVVHRKHGEWRIDNLKSRLRGLEEWSRAIL